MNTVAVSQPAKRSKVWLIIVLGALAAFAPLSIDMYLPALPTMANDLQTNTSSAQLTLTACLLGLALGQLFVGPISDIRGRRGPLLIGLVVYTLASFLCAISPNIWMLVGLRFLQGLAGSGAIVISRAIVRDYYSGSEMTKFFSLLMLVNGLAPILAPIIGGQLLKFTSWQGVFIVLGLLGVIMFLATFFGLKESLPVENRSEAGIRNTLSTLGGIMKDRVFMGYAWSQGLVMASMFAYISGSPFVLQNVYGVSPQLYSLLFAINGIGIVLAGQVTGRLSSKVEAKKVLVTGLLMSLLGAVLLNIMFVSGIGLIGVMVSLFLIVSCVGVVGPTSTSLAMQNHGRSAGSAAALLGVTQLFAGAIASPLVGLGGSNNATPMGLVILVASVGAMLCFVLLARRK
ncbi:multidrug effflux MFS transporter [Tumebacillus sp. ITR2]|uniref:Bcr/CflA family efflux transporter n=1 Tax=Tumebacillus amylolyticus TaxID=2801339 RepID=A0ABS1J4M1_9BACL|nr:multidrug effflux MFS transporter [Tumebacillus amylolyticus]MBL0385227.1 multidrug effflux MFS transporter [Tumebacillus amylolyticus]